METNSLQRKSKTVYDRCSYPESLVSLKSPFYPFFQYTIEMRIPFGDCNESLVQCLKFGEGMDEIYHFGIFQVGKHGFVLKDTCIVEVDVTVHGIIDAL